MALAGDCTQARTYACVCVAEDVPSEGQDAALLELSVWVEIGCSTGSQVMEGSVQLDLRGPDRERFQSYDRARRVVFAMTRRLHTTTPERIAREHFLDLADVRLAIQQSRARGMARR